MKKLINFYQKLTFLQGTAFAISILTVAGLSAHSLSPFNIFTSGQTISASAVNTNFNTLAEAIEASSTMSYLGVWDATSSLPSASLPGDYYIINVADGGYNLNDKIVWNGSSFDQVYAEAQWTKTGNDISYDLGNVSIAQKLRLKSLSANYVELKAPSSVSATYTLTLPPNSGSSGQVLSTDGTGTTFWNNMTDPNVQPFAMSALPTCMAGEVLKSNGTAFSCVTDNAGAVAFNGTPGRAVATDGSGSLIVSSTTSSEMNYLNGVTSPLQAQLSAKLNSTGGTLTVGTINGVPAPMSADDVANKQYVDSNTTWGKTGANIYFQTGNVGIGISNPTSTLQVAGNADISGKIILANGSSSQPTLAFGAGQDKGIFLSGSDALGFSTGSGVERVTITATGDVGIGTPTPSYTLHVNGIVAGSGAYTNTSDERIKKEIKRVPNALEKLLVIEGVSYLFRTNEFPDIKLSTRRELGVVAQKVEKVFPEAVSKDQKGLRSVAYSMLISPIIEAIRSLDTKQKNLEAENKILKNYLCTRDPMAPFCEE